MLSSYSSDKKRIGKTKSDNPSNSARNPESCRVTGCSTGFDWLNGNSCSLSVNSRRLLDILFLSKLACVCGHLNVMLGKQARLFFRTIIRFICLVLKYIVLLLVKNLFHAQFMQPCKKHTSKQDKMLKCWVTHVNLKNIRQNGVERCLNHTAKVSGNLKTWRAWLFENVTPDAFYNNLTCYGDIYLHKCNFLNQWYIFNRYPLFTFSKTRRSEAFRLLFACFTMNIFTLTTNLGKFTSENAVTTTESKLFP